MASTTNVILGAAFAIVFWTFIGLAVARAVLPERSLAWPVAPALGWAVHSAAALPLFMLIGFNRATVAIVIAASFAGGAFVLWRHKPVPGREGLGLPVWAWIGAALLALGPAAAILPKVDGDAVNLASQIFDHSKIAMVDEMIRNGLPPTNPFFGETGQPTRLVYYYLMHFSAAELALLLGFSGWEGDAALTWFSAFASIVLMMGLAIWLNGRRVAALLVLLLAAAGSLRPLLAYVPGIDSVIQPATGFGGWLYQSAWAPQHLAAASCLVLAILLLIELARRDSIPLLVTFVMVVVAGYQSSSWVGGVTFIIAAAWTGVVLLATMEARQRLPFLGRCALAAFCAAALAASFLYDQSAAMAGRGVAWPVAFQTYEVLGEFFPPILRRLVDLPAYWLILLPIEIPAIYAAGLLAMRHFARTAGPERKHIITVLIHLTAASLTVSWLMISTVGGANDLGWRAALPAMIVLTAFAAAGLAHWLAVRNVRLAGIAIVAVVLGLPDGVETLAYNATGSRNDDAKAFAATPNLWTAVRQHAGPTDRIANNPLFLDSMTPWPANISWALLSNRRSCYAGSQLAVPFMPMPLRRVNEIDTLFIRVFAGDGWPDDLRDLATKYDCRVAVVTELDGAWPRDPFATSPHWRLVETSAQGWRIYVVRPLALAGR
jgi:hypothetical protein